MSKKKKIIILSCMVALLAVTAVLNFVFVSRPDKNNTVVSNTSYFQEYKAQHTSSVSEQMLQLDSIISDAKSDSKAKEDALSNKLRLTKNVEKELYLENLIKAKGYKNTVVMLGIDSENVTIVVEDKDFTTDDAVSIYTVMTDEIEISPENVRIIPVA